jgi:hypothetical protein
LVLSGKILGVPLASDTFKKATTPHIPDARNTTRIAGYLTRHIRSPSVPPKKRTDLLRLPSSKLEALLGIDPGVIRLSMAPSSP